MTLVDTERLSEIFNDMKHRAVSIRQLSFVFFGFPTAFWASTSGGFRILSDTLVMGARSA